jgi:mono/diheme cytochrome c family protein
MKQTRIFVIAGLAGALLLGCGKPAPAIVSGQTVPGAVTAINLEQGWSRDTQDRAWFTSFGSRLIPYPWLQHLEQAGNQERFVSDKNMSALGFLTQAPTANNPDGFPVGVTRDTDGKGRMWAGLGCAACHTGEVDYRGTHMRIDGGQALIDFNGFEAALIESLSATVSDSGKFDRFAKALGASGGDRQTLQNEIIALTEKLDARHRMNQVQVPYGYGRLDAFGQIFNAVAVDFLGIPQNRRAPDAPVSFPVLWDAPHLDLVQWNGSAPNAGPGPLLQNITTAMAVYGSMDISGHDGKAGYPSSVDFDHLGQIQAFFYQLKAPQWPAKILGPLDGQRVARGASLYAQQCSGCHQLSNRDDPKRQLKATLTPLPEVGTDPTMAQNFLDAKSDTGAFAGRKEGVLIGAKFGKQAQTSDLIVHAAVGAALRHPMQTMRDAVIGYNKVIKAAISTHPDYYKARPLSGIWASAPYLHNGSVPSLAELLKPPGERVASFYVGSRELDPATVGLVTTQGERSSLFDTKLPGNSNAGHTFGTTLSAQEKLDLLEYLKSL